MTENAYLHSLREKEGWSLKQASKKIGIPIWMLYLYEQGYVRIPKFAIPGFAISYGVSMASFNDVLGYPTALDEDDDIKKKDNKLLKLAISWPSLISVFVIFLVCLGLFIWGYADLEHVGVSNESSYSPEVVALSSFVRQNGEVDSSDSTKKSQSVTTANQSVITVSVMDNTAGDGATAFAFQIPDTESLMALSLSSSSSNPVFAFVEYDSTGETTTYQGNGEISDDRYVLAALFDSDYNAISDETILETQRTYLDSFSDKTAPLFQEWCNSTGFSSEATPNAMVTSIAKTNGELADELSLANNLLLYSTLAGVVFLFGSALLGTMKFIAVKKKKVPVLTVSEPDLPTRGNHPPHPLAPNWKIQPVIPETFFRAVGVLIVLISSILLFNIAVNAMTAFDAKDYTSLISIALAAVDWVKFMPLISVATTLWFFIRIEILHTTENIIPTIVLTFFMGLFYYFAVNAFGSYFSLKNDLYRELLLSLVVSIMPGNLFWGMTCFSSIVLFMLTTPKFKHKGSVIFWRCLTIIPIAYLLGSYLYSIGTSLWGWTTLDSSISGLLYKKEIVCTTFSVLYPFSLYFYRIIVNRKYGAERAKLYFQGNRYYFIKNVIACTILGVLALISYFLHTSKVASSLSLKSSYWVAILIPFILFYHPHIGERNHILDIVFPAAYTISLSFAYVYIAQFILFLA
jgi:hypothetical protein